MSLTAQIALRAGTLDLEVAIETGPGTLVIAGPNGAGKSSLLGALLGSLPLQRGRIVVGDAVLVDTASRIDTPMEERRIGFVPQHYGLFPHLTVHGNIAFAMESTGSLGAASRRAVEIGLQDLGLQSLGARYPRHLSGGEKQRVALARALSVKPRALLLDEPLAALDVTARHAVRQFLSAYLRKMGVPCVLVTHDAADARVLGDRIAVLESGRITQTGTWNEIVTRPATPFIAAFVGQPDGSVSP